MNRPIATVKARDGGYASEIEYKDENGIVVGYWAYGNYDPELPYQGGDYPETMEEITFVEGHGNSLGF